MKKKGFSAKAKSFALRNASKLNFLKEWYYYVPYYLFDGSSFKPFNATILLTYRCNLRCKMCFYYSENDAYKTLDAIKSKGKELSLEETKNLIDELVEAKVSVLTLHGGEPLIKRDFFDIVEYAVSKGLLVNFVSNGALLTKESAKRIVELGINHITFSLDGPVEVHDRIRGKKGTFESLLKGISFIEEEKRFSSAEHPVLSIATTISSENYKHLSKVMEIASGLGIKQVNYTLSTYSSSEALDETKKLLGIKKNSKEGSLLLPEGVTSIPAEELKRQRVLVKDKASKLGIKAVFPSLEAIEQYPDPDFNELKKCTFPWNRAVISPYGEVFPCVNLGTLNCSFGNIRKKSFLQIWNSSRFKAFRKKLRKNGLLSACSKCCAVSPGN